MNFQNRFVQSLYFIATALVAMAPALYNRYPLVYFDSGAYMEMAASLEPSLHRAIGYPILMRLTGFMTSNWPIVFIQGLLISVLTYQLIKLLVARRRHWVHFFTICTLSFTTSLSWYTAQLMPDIFTFIAVLTITLIVLKPDFNWRSATFYGLLLALSLITHLSHIPLLLIILGGFAILHFLRYQRLDKMAWMSMGGALVSAFLFITFYNAAWGYGMRLSMASNVFITANIGEMGFLKLYLDENCDEKELALCAIKDELPLETGGYLWDKGNPIELHDGGWLGMNEDCAPIVHDFLTKPRYLKWFLFGSLKATFKQMFQIELGSGLQYTYADGSPPSWPMHSHFKQELNEYLVSVQNKDASQLPLGFFRMVNYISLFLSILILGWAVLTQRLNDRLILLLLVFLACYFLNAAITGVLANVYERLQCRLLPLFPLAAIIILATFNKLPGLSENE